MRGKDTVHPARVTCRGVTNTRQCIRQHKSSEQRQALYSGAEGSTRTLFLSPLLNTLLSPPPNEYSCACVKSWTSSSPLCTPRRTDSSILLYPSLHLQYSRRCVFLPSLSYSRFTFHSVHLCVSLYLIFTDTTVCFMFNTYAAIRYPVITQFEANVEPP